MEKMRMESVDLTAQNIEKIAALFPSAVTEMRGEDGTVKKGINFEVLKQLLSKDVVDGDECYEFTWVGKKAAIAEAARPTTKTLRPVVEDSRDWDTTENLYIEGDNLEVLKILQESYLGKVKVIYIDPPYNTGSGLIYRNNFFQTEDDYLEDIGAYDENHNRLFLNTKSNGRFHSDWCSMIFSRLILARNILSDDGIIVLTIDDSEIENVTSIMNEVFGEENHLATVVIKNNPSGRSTVKGFSINHEYALFYSKSDAATLGRMKHTEDQKSRYKETDSKGCFEWENFRKNGTDSDRGDRPKQYYPIFLHEDTLSIRIPDVSWNDCDKSYSVDETPALGEVILWPKTSDGVEKVWKYGIERAKTIIDELLVKKQKGNYEIYRKKYLNDEGSLPRTWWDKAEYSARDNGTRTLTNIFGPIKIFDFPKAPEAVKDALIAANLQDGDVVLDFFSGSATTADAIMHLNAEDHGHRKFIMVQLPEKADEDSEAYKMGYPNICEIGKERIRRAGDKIRRENPAVEMDTGFRVFRVDDSNMEDVYYHPEELDQQRLGEIVSNIKQDRSDLDLLYSCLLDWGVEINLPHTSEKVDGCTVHNVDNGALMACFDGKITDKVVAYIAERKPLRVVFRDDSFASDADRINIEEAFKNLSPDTQVKVI